MKEAAGEANLTVIAIILIAVVAAVVTPLINSYLRTAGQKSCCTNYGGIWRQNGCYNVTTSGDVGSKINTSSYYDIEKRICNDDLDS